MITQTQWLALLLVVRAGAAAAAETTADTHGGWYAGASSDTTHVEVWRGGAWEIGGESKGISVRGGLRVSKHFAVELAALRAANLEWTEYFASILGLPGAYDSHTTFDSTALQASAVAIVPFGRVWEAFAKGGIAQYRVSGQQSLDDSFGNATDLTRSVSDSGMGTVIGFGLTVRPASRWRLRAEVQFFDIDKAFLGVPDGDDPTIDTFGIGVDYAFGQR